MNENLKVGMVFKNVNPSPLYKKWNTENQSYARITEIDNMVHFECWYENSQAIYHCSVLEWNPLCWEPISESKLN